MTILVTGATSGLGRNAVDFLRARGEPLRATGRNALALRELCEGAGDVQAAELSTLDEAQARMLLAGVDTVWHCAALSSPWGRAEDFVAANVTATTRLARFAVAQGVKRFVHISTPSLYFDFRHRLEVPESGLADRPCNDYVRTKLAAEQVIRRLAAEHPQTRFVILRPKALFGPHDRVLLPRILQLLKARHGTLPLPRGGEAKLDLTYAPNAVHAMWLATQARGLESAATFNITNQQPTSLRAVLAQLLGAELGIAYGIRSVAYPLLDLAARGMQAVSAMTGKEPMLTRYSAGALHYDMTLANAAAKRDLHYTPIHDMAGSIRLTAEWLKKTHGPHHVV